jgi:hypothetical protein
VANSAKTILTLISTRESKRPAARQLWPASGRLARRSWTDSVAMTLGILATTSATPADDRAAGCLQTPDVAATTGASRRRALYKRQVGSSRRAPRVVGRRPVVHEREETGGLRPALGGLRRAARVACA